MPSKRLEIACAKNLVNPKIVVQHILHAHIANIIGLYLSPLYFIFRQMHLDLISISQIPET